MQDLKKEPLDEFAPAAKWRAMLLPLLTSDPLELLEPSTGLRESLPDLLGLV